MARIPEKLQAPAAGCRSGPPVQAGQGFPWILRRDPHQAEALEQLGLLAYQTGSTAQAVDYWRRAAEARPADANLCNNLGLGLASLGRFGEAEAAFREALRRRPDFPEAHLN